MMTQQEPITDKIQLHEVDESQDLTQEYQENFTSRAKEIMTSPGRDRVPPITSILRIID